MSIGNQPTLASLNQALGNVAIDLRNAVQAAINLNDDITAAGGAAYLQGAPFDMTAPDADSYISTLGNLAAYAAGFTGSAVPILNYRLDSAPAWGGQ